MRYYCRTLIALALVACSPDAPKQIATVGEALPGLPLPPEARVVARGGSPDALQITFQSGWSADSLINLYRAVLSNAPWELQNDVLDSEGARVLYATRQGPPIWVRIKGNVGAPGSTIQIMGAAVTSTTTP